MRSRRAAFSTIVLTDHTLSTHSRSSLARPTAARRVLPCPGVQREPVRGIPEPQFGDLVASALEVVDGQVVPEGILAAQEDDEALGQPVVVVPSGKLPHIQDSLVVPEALPGRAKSQK